MIDVTILTLRNAVVASIADSFYVFSKVNEFLMLKGKRPLFQIHLVGLSNNVDLFGGLFTVHPNNVLTTATTTDLIIIPSLTGDMMSATHLNRDFGDWIAKQYKNGAEVASLCSGAFLLAFSGLLKGKQCTTHWYYANEFKHYYPSVKTVDERVITHQQGLYSSGGSNAYWNLLIYLIEKYAGRDLAIYTAKYFVVDLDKDNQSPFIVFHGFKDHKDLPIRSAQSFIENNFSEKVTVEQLAEKFNMTRRTFERRFKKATTQTPIEYIQRVKVEAAKKQFEIGRKSIQEVMLDVGYSDLQTFRDVFKRITGVTPLDYKNKYLSRMN